MNRAPKRSAGVCQNYNDFDLIDTLAYQARTTGLKGNELNFVLLKQGDLVRGSEFQNGLDRTHEYNPNNDGRRVHRGPDAPRPRQKLRDDLELELAMRNRPRP